MTETRIIGIRVTNRMKEAPKLQQLMSEYGCYIKTRIGLHEVQEDFCSENGIILLELFGDMKMKDEFEAKLNALEGIEMQRMVFTNDD